MRKVLIVNETLDPKAPSIEVAKRASDGTPLDLFTLAKGKSVVIELEPGQSLGVEVPIDEAAAPPVEGPMVPSQLP